MRNKYITFLTTCIRWPDIAVLIAFPIMGAIFSLNNISMESMALTGCFSILSILFLIQVFMYNDISDAVRNPKEPSRRIRHALKGGMISEKSARIICIILFLLSLSGYAFISMKIAVFVFLIEIFTFLYSNPVIKLKGVPLLSLLVLFLCGFLYFLSGWLLFQPVNKVGILIGIYFALVLSAGHLSNEIDDLDSDREARILTNAIFFNEKNAFLAGIVLFIISSVLFVYIAFNIMDGIMYIYLSVIMLLTWLIFFIYYIISGNSFSIKTFRRMYRILYAMFCIIVTVLRFINLSGYIQ
jgi:lycopene elongase/hydratase (dihydrobisanhydrobacterioruberin-forming)